MNAVLVNGVPYCKECCPIDPSKAVPIFASDSWDYYPTCVECYKTHTYMRLKLKTYMVIISTINSGCVIEEIQAISIHEALSTATDTLDFGESITAILTTNKGEKQCVQ